LTEEYFKRQAKRLKQDQRADILRAEGKDVSVETTNAQLEKRVKALNQLTAAQKAAAAAGLLDLAKLEDTNEILAGIRKAGDYEYGGPKYMMMQEEQRRLDRQQERLLADRRLDQNYQLEITRLQSKDRERAQNRKDRMFLQLMAGLQNLGQGFTI
jgi:pyruvate/2-oxoglutarate/acetoin dehydrogenase E1 component